MWYSHIVEYKMKIKVNYGQMQQHGRIWHEKYQVKNNTFSLEKVNESIVEENRLLVAWRRG